MKKSARLFAEFISFLFHPVFLLLTAPFLIVYRTTNNLHISLLWFVISLFFILFVVMYVLVGVKHGKFSNIDMSNRKQRKPAYILAIGVILFYTAIIVLLNGPVQLFISVLSILAGATVLMIANMRIKASVHIASITAFVLSIAILFGGQFIFLLLVIPLVGWSRFMLKRHTLQEMMVGGSIASILIMTLYILLKVFVPNSF